MENPFKKILNNEDLPDVLKSKVIDDISMIKLTIDFADLFVVKYPSAIEDIIMAGESEKRKEEEK